MRQLILLPLAAAIACGGGATGDSVDRRTIIDSRDEYDPRSLDPALSTDVPTGRAVAYLFDGLTRFDPEAKLEPALAERWEVSPDGLVYTFHLRRGVQFHDGTPLVARHVVSSFQRVLDPAVRGGRGWPLYPIRGAEQYAGGTGGQSVAGLAAPDDSTVVITLKEPFAIFPKLLAMPVAAIVPDRTPQNFGERPVGTGPWKLVEWKHDDYLLFARNENYWGGAPQADSLRARIIAEPSTAVAEFESGRVDVLRIPQGEARQWEEDASRKEQLQSAPALQLVYIGINTTRGPLRDVRVRQAINHAIDVPTIINSLVSGRGTPAAGVIPPTLEGADESRRPYGFDVNRAKQLLAEAGHPNGIDVDLWVGANPIFMRMAEAVQGYLNQAGIRTKIVQRETAAAREASRAGQTDLFLKDWFADYPDAENFLYPLLHSANKGVGGNISFYENPRFDQLVTASRRELDDARRVQLYRDADALAFQDAPMVFLYFYNELFAVQRWIDGFRIPTIFNGQRWTDVKLRGTQ
jgi:ABC-type transport system substrate-binding protein